MERRNGTCRVVVGAQWGDEGKGKIVDVLAEGADVVARYQGGANAGHTVVVAGEEFVLHQVPSGVLHREKECLLGNGVVIDVAELFRDGGIAFEPAPSARFLNGARLRDDIAFLLAQTGRLARFLWRRGVRIVHTNDGYSHAT